MNPISAGSTSARMLMCSPRSSHLYILPSLMGAVLVQSIVAMKSLRPTVIALALALVMNFVVVPAAPATGMFATATVVISSIIFSWVLRDRKKIHTSES
ncbi:hypothetical protein ACLQ8T_13375 [Glutamicibacter sp. FR1]|uniref:hypothetical protein n=1 Tax=Glutamicibacter sp. FR1 TaxID=3393744 RepID=UPI0039B0A06E